MRRKAEASDAGRREIFACQESLAIRSRHAAMFAQDGSKFLIVWLDHVGGFVGRQCAVHIS